MNLTQPLVLAGLGALLGMGGTGIAVFLRSRRARRKAARREQLKTLGKKTGMELLGVHLPSDLVEAASRFRQSNHGGAIDEMLLGNDREGRFYLARRVVCGVDHQVFGFEIRGELNVRGLHIEPRPPRDHRPWWQQRLKPQKPTSSKLRLDLRWESDAARFEDELTRQAVQRWTAQVAQSCSAGGKCPIGLEVHGDRGLVHSLVPLEGLALQEFHRRSHEIRRMVLDEIRRRPATLSAPAVSRTSEDRDVAREGAVDTRPLFPVRGSEDVDPESKTIQLSAADLLREAPDPRSTRRRRVSGDDEFQIPEPSEKVTVIRSN